MNPHLVIERVFPYEKFPGFELWKCDADLFEKTNYSKRLFQSMAWFFSCFSRLFCVSGRQIIFREFNVFSLILVLLPTKNSLAFIINHNMSDRKNIIISKLMLIRYELIMLDGSDQMKLRYPEITYVTAILSPEKKLPLEKSIIIFVGNRLEQMDYSFEEIRNFISALSEKGFRCLTCGSNYGYNYMPQNKLDKMLPFSHAVVLFSDGYRNRNSGTVWTIVEKCPVVCVKNNSVFYTQAEVADVRIGYQCLNDLHTEICGLHESSSV